MPDTPIWSAVLRRSLSERSPQREEMARLLQRGLVEIAGPIRQELLSGISDRAQFETVRGQLRDFPDLPIQTEDYEAAAVCYNRCRARGIQGSGNDFLLCALALRHDLLIWTTDRDFLHYKKILGIEVYPGM